ncbi:MAG: polysaccharide chain length determinant protein, locus subfamily [Rhodocyclaceae bacterium]|nr:polysaccharide chain length determinant protein, locus subfamily [Rhodocyclaceae bacterium]
MDDLIRQAVSNLRAMWKHRWLGVLVAWLVAAAGSVGIALFPNKYEASARIYVDTQSILKPLMTGLAVQPNIDQQIVMLSRTLINRPNVEKLIRMADLDLESQTKEDKDSLVDGLIKSIEIKSASSAPGAPAPGARDNLYSITYRHTDPEKARRVVQSLVSIFVESSMGDTRKDTDSARKFLDEQIKVYEKKLEVAENRLKEFKLRNLEIQAEDGRSMGNRLAEIGNELNKARLDLREAENSRDALKRQIVGEDPVLLPDGQDSENGIAIPDIDSRIDVQKRNLDTLLQRYTEQHPDVLGARRMIKDLEEQKRQEIAARRKAGPGNGAMAVSNNPVYQQLRISLAEAEANVASLRTRVQEFESRQQHMKELMKIAPQIEAELAQLNRDYEVTKKNYEGLVTRRESADISGNLDSVAGMADFRLVDPPRVAPKPVAPNRLLLLPLALLLSLAAGVFATFVASRLRPVFFDSRLLRQVTSLPLLGSVYLVESESGRHQEKSELRRFFVASGGLLAAFGAGLAVLVAMSKTVV